MNDMMIDTPRTPPRNEPGEESPATRMPRLTTRDSRNRQSIRRQFRNNLNLSNIFEEMRRSVSPQPREFNANDYPLHSEYPLESENPETFSPNDLAFDVIEGANVTIQNYLNEPDTESEQRFVLHLNGEYICQSLQGMKMTNSYNGNMSDLNEFYECKDETPSDWQGNTYVREWVKPNGKGPIVKIMGPGGFNFLIEKPAFFWNGPVPEPRVFNMVELPYKMKKYVSSFLLPMRDNFSAYGVDHCNQLSSERVYRIELMKPQTNTGGKLYRKRNTQKKRKTKKQKKQNQKRKNKKLTKKRKT